MNALSIVENARSRVVDYGFFAALALATFLFYRTIRAVLTPVILGAFLSVLARPFFERMERRVHARRFAAAVTTVGVLLLVVIPIALLAWAVVDELASAAAGVSERFARGGIVDALDEIPIVGRLRRTLRLEPEDLRRVADTVVVWSASLLRRAFAAASAMVAGGFLLAISLYYFLVDGPRWRHEIERIAPIHRRYVRAFTREFVNVSHALFYGSLVTAIVQGVVSYVSYVIFRVPQPILWGAATAVMSITPIIGTAVVWAPIAIYLAATGAPWRALGVAIWGMAVTGTVDNVIRPLLMQGRMRLHPLIVFLAIIGGVAAFGMFGIFAGPLAAALFLAAIRIYDLDYRQRMGDAQTSSPIVTP